MTNSKDVASIFMFAVLMFAGGYAFTWLTVGMSAGRLSAFVLIVSTGLMFFPLLWIAAELEEGFKDES